MDAAPSDSQDPLVIQDLADSVQTNEAASTDAAEEGQNHNESLSFNPAGGSTTEVPPPPYSPDHQVPNIIASSFKQEPVPATDPVELNENKEILGSTVIEESNHSFDGRSEKKLSESEQGHLSYSQKLASSCKCCQVLLRKNYDLPEHPTHKEKLRYAFTCPPHGRVGDILIWILAGLSGWGCLVSITGEQALPGGNFFSLIVLYIMAVLGGEAIQMLGLPSLLGSLLVGILLKSIPGLNVIGNNIDTNWSAALRSIALVIILIRAGLGLDPVALKKLSFTVIRLAFTPCIVETVSTAIASWLLLDLPWSWGFMLGFILAAVSPAVVVPCMLKLSEDGYGVDKGIPTLVIAAASIDDVLAISGFSVMQGLTFAKGSAAWTIAKGPVEIFIGILYGIVLGLVCWFLPYREKKRRAVYKLIILFTLSCLALFGSEMADMKSAGAIGVLTLAFAAGLEWRKPEMEDPEVEDYFRSIWGVFMPLMFSLIGAEVDIQSIKPDTIGWGLLTLAICLTFRVITSFFVVMGGDFTVWERLFIAIAWLPKATVQAAIGSNALDYARQAKLGPVEIERGEQVVTIAVMVILVTAPLGAAAIKLTGPRFLAKKASSVQRSSDEPETTV